MPAVIPENVPDIRYYASREGELIPLIAGSMPEAVAEPPLLLGVNIDGDVHPIFDRRRRWIMVDLFTRQIIPVTLNLYHAYSDTFPVHILERLTYNNGGLAMPRNGNPNVQHIASRNVRRRHNYATWP